MENQRIRLTKQMLKDALTKLLKEKPLEKITIQELCQTAQINRTTFYKYYGNQHDLLKEIQQEFLDAVENALRLKEGNDILPSILQYIYENREHVAALVNTLDESFLRSLTSLSLIQMTVHRSVPEEYHNWKEPYFNNFLFSGAYSVIRSWLNAEHPEPPEQMAELINTLVLPLLRQ